MEGGKHAAAQTRSQHTFNLPVLAYRLGTKGRTIVITSAGRGRIRRATFKAAQRGSCSHGKTFDGGLITLSRPAPGRLSEVLPYRMVNDDGVRNFSDESMTLGKLLHKSYIDSRGGLLRFAHNPRRIRNVLTKFEKMQAWPLRHRKIEPMLLSHASAV